MTFENKMNEILIKENVFLDFVSQFRNSGKKIFLFGAGYIGSQYVKIFEQYGVKIEGIIDNQKTEYFGHPLLKLDDVKAKYDVENCIFVISSMRYLKEIKKQLLGVTSADKIYAFAMTLYANPVNGLDNIKRFYSEHTTDLEQIYGLLNDNLSRNVMLGMVEGRVTADYRKYQSVWTGDAYYPSDLINFGADEVMVELGANDGKTLLEFIKRCPNFKKAYCFEPDKDCIVLLENIIKPYGGKVQIVPKIAWNKKDLLCFDMHGGDGSSNVSNDRGGQIEAASVDDEVQESITYMKMDIEGSEMKALEGAKNQIVKNKPRLAVCVYHKPEDIIDIPRYILSIRSDYKLYLRHEGFDDGDTVLYAI